MTSGFPFSTPDFITHSLRIQICLEECFNISLHLTTVVCVSLYEQRFSCSKQILSLSSLFFFVIVLGARKLTGTSSKILQNCDGILLLLIHILNTCSDTSPSAVSCDLKRSAFKDFPFLFVWPVIPAFGERFVCLGFLYLIQDSLQNWRLK